MDYTTLPFHSTLRVLHLSLESAYIESLFFKDYSDAYIKTEISKYCGNIYKDEINLMLMYRKKITEFDKKHFVAIRGEKSFVFRITTDNEGYSKLEALSHKNFVEHYSNRYISVPTLVSDLIIGEMQPIAVHWLYHHARTTYDGVIFYPSHTLPEKYLQNKFYNEWKGFYVTPKQGEFPLLDSHFKHIWCCGDQNNYQYLMIWFADIIQHPERKAGIALVLKGGKGSGKSFIFENLIEPILGNMFMKLERTSQLTGKFNQHQCCPAKG